MSGSNVWKKLKIALAVFTAVFTVFELILPATTMEQETYCLQEEHIHSVECYERRLICDYGDLEMDVHIHSDECYETQQTLVCTKVENSGHIHDESCIETEQILICSEEHEHTEQCYKIQESWICGMDEGEGAHVHGTECYETQNTLICDISEGHVHTEACYESVLVCEKTEHEHTLSCYSDPEADIESETVWQRSIAGADLAGNRAQDLIETARTQLGYQESTKNYIVTEQGEMKGITRYGQWYGFPYGNWSAMFVSFCLNQAGISPSVIPYEENSARWVEQLKTAGLFVSAFEYVPCVGDLIFFDENGDSLADHVGIVVQLDEEISGMTVIEGDVENQVKQNRYNWIDERILGFGTLPEEENHPEITEISADVYMDESQTVLLSEVNVMIAGELAEGVNAKAWSVKVEQEEVQIQEAYSIGLWMNGEPYYSETELSVRIQTPTISEKESLHVYQSDENGEFKRIEAIIEDDRIVFETDKLTTFAIGTENNEKTAYATEKRIYRYEDSDISVTAVLEDPDALPENVELKVTKVDADVEGYNYDAYMQALNDSTGIVNAYRPDNTLLYDIAFLAGPGGETLSEGQAMLEYQPSAGLISLSFTFKDGLLTKVNAEEEEEVQVVHLPLEETIRKQNPTTSEATEIRAENVEVESVSAEITDQAVTFNLDNFSLVAFIKNEGGTTTEITDVTPGTELTYLDILGDAVYYGITANNVEKIAHMDSNFATKVATSKGGNVTAGAYTNDHRGSSFIIGELTGTLQIDGYASTVYTTEEASDHLTLQNGSYYVLDTQSHLNQLVTDMMGYVTKQSEAMFAEQSYEVLTFGTHWNGTDNVEEWYDDQNDKELDISEYSEGTYYINGDLFLKKDDVKIKKKSNQTIVFNLSGEKITLKRFSIIDADTGQTIQSDNTHNIEPYARTVIFNIPNASSVSIGSGIFGIVIAPKAEVIISSTSSGWIVADKVGNPGGEWHFVGQIIPESTAIVNIEAKKTVDGYVPTEQQEFTFALEQWNGTEWTDRRTVTNQLGNILFQNRYEESGTWYYRLTEVAGTDASYHYDASQYVIRVDIQKTAESIQLSTALTYYKTETVAGCTDNNQINEIVFQNMTSGESGYVLPETGGDGTRMYTYTGAFMVITAVILLLRKRWMRKGDIDTT